MLIIFTALFLVLFDNFSFFSNTLKVYPVSNGNILFLLSLTILLFSFTVFLLVLVSSKYTIKPVLISILLISSISSYFMNSFGIVLDEGMLINSLQTNVTEAFDLINIKFSAYLIFLGITPSYMVFKIRIKENSLHQEGIHKITLITSSLFLLILVTLIFSKHYASFFREHKILRMYTNPIFPIYSSGKFIAHSIKTLDIPIITIDHDAAISSKDIDRELIILVVGETARADRFSLNGYHKKTNPLLEKENVISFKNMSSCGTSTAVSVPCIFSKFEKDNYTDEKGTRYENILDLLSHLGVNILWRDNNSDSKGVALRVPYQDYRTAQNNHVCDNECRDEGMLIGLQDYINKQSGDILIVLHQMGNHGPAYYKRYPKDFEVFIPACQSKDLEKCSMEEINNAYDNAIIYTDYFLSKAIKLLKDNNNKFETALFYISDHGESLGENGIYLHGMPYMFAPDKQTQVASIFWAGKHMEINYENLKLKELLPISHDNIFHMLLGLFEVNSKLYNKQLDIIDYLEKD